MGLRSRSAAVAVGALCALALSTSTALAVRGIRLQPAGEITKTVEAFTIRAWGGELTITCKLTLTGRLATFILKAAAGRLPGGRMGQIEGWAVEGCRTNFGGAAEVTLLLEPAAPVNLRYQAFLGALPEITGIRFRKLAFELRVVEPVLLGTCLFSGMVDLLLGFPPVIEAGGRKFTPESFVTPNAIPKTGGILCPESVEVSGAGRVLPPQGALLVE